MYLLWKMRYLEQSSYGTDVETLELLSGEAKVKIRVTWDSTRLRRELSPDPHKQLRLILQRPRHSFVPARRQITFFTSLFHRNHAASICFTLRVAGGASRRHGMRRAVHRQYHQCLSRELLQPHSRCPS